MEYFKKYFKEVENWESEEVKVRCPFHSDEHPSASINTEKSEIKYNRGENKY